MKRIIKLLIAMVFCILAAEFTISRTLPYIDSNNITVEKLNNLSEIKGSYNRIILGDSRSHQGINPKILDSDSTYSTYNLAAPGMQTPFFYYTLSKWIRYHGAPDEVVVNISFYLLGGMQWMDDIYFAYYTPTIEEAWDSYVNQLNYSGKDAIGWYFRTRIPSLRYNKRIRTLLNSSYSSIRKEIKDNRILLDKQVYGVEDYRGYYGRGTSHISTEDISETNYSTTVHEGYSVYIDYLERFFELSNKYDFDIYIYDFPWPEQYAEFDNFVEVYTFYDNMICEIADKYPRVHKISNELYYSVDYFIDPLHVNEYGAAKLSKEVGDLINGQK